MGGATNPIIGSLLNGIGTNMAAGNDPVKGALMNASMLAGSGGMNTPMAAGSPPVPVDVFASAGPQAQMGSSSAYPGVDFANYQNPFPQSSAINAPAASSFSLNQIPQIARDNPVLTQFGLQTAQGLLTPDPMPQAPMMQVQRGQPLPPVNFASLLNPQQYRPQPISLLG